MPFIIVHHHVNMSILEYNVILETNNKLNYIEK